MNALEPGSKVAGFELPTGPDESVKLSEALDQNDYTIVAFYPAAWSPVCGDEMAIFEAALEEFHRLGAGIVGISVDNIWANMAWADAKGISYPLLSDFEPKGAVAASFGVMRDDGVTERALFILDREGSVVYSYVSPILENPGADGLLDALEALQSNE